MYYASFCLCLSVCLSVCMSVRLLVIVSGFSTVQLSIGKSKQTTLRLHFESKITAALYPSTHATFSSVNLLSCFLFVIPRIQLVFIPQPPDYCPPPPRSKAHNCTLFTWTQKGNQKFAITLTYKIYASTIEDSSCFLVFIQQD